jgi:hypothetical protein
MSFNFLAEFLQAVLSEHLAWVGSFHFQLQPIRLSNSDHMALKASNWRQMDYMTVSDARESRFGTPRAIRPAPGMLRPF